MFEAVASLKGDIANESVQHAEFAASIGRDVVEPLVRLKEGGETVMKLVSRLGLCMAWHICVSIQTQCLHRSTWDCRPTK